MTRYELVKLKNIRNVVEDRPGLAAYGLDQLIADAEAECAREDRYHDAAEADAYPLNAEAA